ncbi:MAG TPA: hypothetical protein VHA56_12530 [Mucilaginibacter sp.]|nr:hypothetical protein [Mucilaginibacter sp.]
MKTIQFMLLGLVILILSACKKNDVVKISTVTNSDLSTRSVTENPANSLNPFDSVGYWHNKVLEGIQPCIEKINGLGEDAVTGCVIQFATTANLSPPNLSFDNVGLLVKDQVNNYRNILHAMSISQPVKTGLDTLFNIIKRSASQPEINYGDFKTAVMNYETKITEDEGLTAVQKETLLKSSSVARFSFCYWMNDHPNDTASIFKNITKWIATVTSDVAGIAVSGNVAYAADCSQYAYELVSYGMP